jgi:hypothetical protein
LKKRDSKGRFISGVHAWREEKPFWNKEWCIEEYLIKQRSMGDIAVEFGVTCQAIRFWISKHGIKSRNVSESRSIKYWGASGENNPMFGKYGPESSNWKGGITPERQSFYASMEWKQAVKNVWKRDGGVCRRCGKIKRHRQDEYHIHHIESFMVVEKRTDEDNLIIVCKACHNWIHSKENTDNEFIR